jgi:hypothetical protein
MVSPCAVRCGVQNGGFRPFYSSTTLYRHSPTREDLFSYLTHEWFEQVLVNAHQVIQQIIDRGRADGTITRDVTPRDIVVLGAMLAQPRRSDPSWDATCLRLLATYVAGLGCGSSAADHP